MEAVADMILCTDIARTGHRSTVQAPSSALDDAPQSSPELHAERVERLCRALSERERYWSDEDVALSREVAAVMRKSVEVVQASRREHEIATQLQAALLPKLADSAAGLELADYYRPALEESEVGGDFADMFTVDNDITFFVLGDVSGKGLAAAAQIATVRNMLRYALYHGRTLAGPVLSLNRMLTENNLLEGFVTVFVARYDHRVKTLTYVNCGQEPALLRRSASGQVEELGPTGPVLGVVDVGPFHEEIVRLEDGDAVVMYTDGLTEVGPSRSQQLGVEGLKVLLQRPFLAGFEPMGGGRAERLLLRLIAGVDAYTRGGTRDDMCMLVAVASS